MSECATTPGAVLALIASPVSGSGHLDPGNSSHHPPSPLANCVFINRDRDVRFCFGAARGWEGSSFFSRSVMERFGGVEGETGAGVVFCGALDGGENWWRRLIARDTFRCVLRHLLRKMGVENFGTPLRGYAREENCRRGFF